MKNVVSICYGVVDADDNCVGGGGHLYYCCGDDDDSF